MVIELTTGGARAVARCDMLGVAPYSDLPDRLFRAYLTPAHTAAIEALADWMAEANMVTRVDAAGNLIGRYEGRRQGAPTILNWSHIDSVRDAGRYDGPLGILLGIECVNRLPPAERRLDCAVEVIAFGDEEGSRLPVPMHASRAMAGTLAGGMLDAVDQDGVSLADALAGRGLDVTRFADAARDPGTARAFVEVHIEQGPALEAAGFRLASVTGIAAQCRFRIEVGGRAGHAGTTAMSLRQDALAGAAEMVLEVEHIGRAGPSDLVATVGMLSVEPGAPNVVPGSVSFSLDVCAGENRTCDAAAENVAAAVERIAAARGLQAAIVPMHTAESSPCDPALVALMDRAIAEAALDVLARFVQLVGDADA